jgi:hypothetical protein
MNNIFPDSRVNHLAKTHPDLIEIDISATLVENKIITFGGVIFMTLESQMGVRCALTITTGGLGPKNNTKLFSNDAFVSKVDEKFEAQI